MWSRIRSFLTILGIGLVTIAPLIAIAAYFLYAEVPDIWTWTGAAIIVGSALYIAHRERAHRPAPPTEPHRDTS